jgi:hypothetical protein
MTQVSRLSFFCFLLHFQFSWSMKRMVQSHSSPRVVLSPPVMPSCEYKHNSKCNCAEPTTSTVHRLSYYSSDEQIGSPQRQQMEFMNAISCVQSNDHLCFYGDSLVRQLFVEMACKYGHEHHSEPVQAGNNVTFNLPSASTLPNNAVMHHRFFHLDKEQVLIHTAKGDRCTKFIFSFGIWYIIDPGFKKSLSQYRESLTNTFQILKTTFPDVSIFLKPTLSASFRTDCYYPEQRSSSPTVTSAGHSSHEDREDVIVQFNEVLDEVCESHEGCRIIGKKSSNLYQISEKSNCEKTKTDPIHFCQCPGRPSPVHDTAAEMLLQEICHWQFKI